LNLRKSIKMALAKYDKSTNWLAKKMGVSHQRISNMCKANYNCTMTTAESVARAFDLPLSEFIALGESGDE